MAVFDFILLQLAVLEYFEPFVFQSVYFFYIVEPYILYGIGGAVVPGGQGEKDSGCIRADGGRKDDSRFL
ncbi:MAG: hypothetical protein HDR16_11300 [Lachnospiraceae bacterium]|nr:hypothetical protein [Lachnospiraceae bacterium]